MEKTFKSWSEDELETLLNAIAEGKSKAEISKEMEVPMFHITGKCKQLAYEYHVAGQSHDDIASKLGLQLIEVNEAVKKYSNKLIGIKARELHNNGSSVGEIALKLNIPEEQVKTYFFSKKKDTKNIKNIRTGRTGRNAVSKNTGSVSDILKRINELTMELVQLNKDLNSKLGFE